MGSRTLDITVVSATKLKKAGIFTRMNVYTIVTIFGESQTTSVDRDCGVKPKWNHQMRFNIDESAAMGNQLTIVYCLKSTSSCFGDRDLGQVFVPLKEILLKSINDETEEDRPQSYNITTPSGRSKGVLNVSYKFGPLSASTNNNPGMAYRPPPPLPQQDYVNPTAAAPQGRGYPPQETNNAEAVAYPPPGYPPAGYLQPQPQAAYPPPNVGYAAGAPPPHPGGYTPLQGPMGMNYPPPPPGPAMVYAAGGYAVPPQPPGYATQTVASAAAHNFKNNNKKKGMAAGLGLGVGAGLLGGLAGGMALAALGEEVGDVNYGDYGEGYYGGGDYFGED